jgi:hypothetical protein
MGKWILGSLYPVADIQLYIYIYIFFKFSPVEFLKSTDPKSRPIEIAHKSEIPNDNFDHFQPQKKKKKKKNPKPEIPNPLTVTCGCSPLTALSSLAI